MRRESLEVVSGALLSPFGGKSNLLGGDGRREDGRSPIPRSPNSVSLETETEWA
jgi:hypothetical protein